LQQQLLSVGQLGSIFWGFLNCVLNADRCGYRIPVGVGAEAFGDYRECKTIAAWAVAIFAQRY